LVYNLKNNFYFYKLKIKSLSWIKILEDKILLYSSKNSVKAKSLIDLSECEVRGSYISESILLLKNNLDIQNQKIPSNKSIEELISRPGLNSINLLNGNLLFVAEQKENFSSNCMKISENPNCINIFRKKMNSTSNVFGFRDNAFSDRFSFSKFEKENNNLNNNDDKDSNFSSNESLTGLFKQRLNYEIEIQHPFLEKCIIRGSNILEAFDLHKKIQQIISEYD